jgi:hypothetical protein
MLQPFEKFTQQYLGKLIQLNKNFLVSQGYKRGYDHFNDKTAILLTDHENAGAAQMHYNAVKADPYASIINLEKPAHKAKVIEMLEGDKYSLYWSVVPGVADLKKRMEKKYKDHIRRYIQLTTNWRIGGDEKIETQLEVVFGELFIIIKWRTKRLRLTFEEIESS